MPFVHKASVSDEVPTKGWAICMESAERSRITFSKHLGLPLGSPYNHNHDPAGWLPPPCLSPKGGLRGREAIVFFTAAVVITVAVVRGRPSVQSRDCAVIIKRVYTDLHRLRRAATGEPSPP